MTSTPLEPPTGTVAELGERQLIARIHALTPEPPSWVAVGIGDDAAVIEPARTTLDVVTTDTLVDGVHIDRRYTSAGDIGHKVLAASLSDLAAMGAAPRAGVLSLVLPSDFPVADVDALVGSLVALATRHSMALVGGNVTRSPGPLVVEVTAIGSVRRRKVLTRTGAQPGDALYVSGTVGAASAGLAWLEARANTATGSEPHADGSPPQATTRFLRPEPRVRLGTLLGRSRAASACIDLSDGLGAALHQLAEASGVGITLDGAAVPVDPEARDWFAARGQDPLDAALAGGEDYELAFTVSPRSRGRLRHVRRLVGDVPLTRVGSLTDTGRVVMTGADGERNVSEGWVHFDGGREG